MKIFKRKLKKKNLKTKKKKIDKLKWLQNIHTEMVIETWKNIF